MCHHRTVCIQCLPPNVSSLQLIIYMYRGIYVPDESRWPEKFRGMGIRIEDSVCVGDEDPITLTPEAVKEVCPEEAVV